MFYRHILSVLIKIPFKNFFYYGIISIEGFKLEKDSVGYFMVIISNKELRIRSFDKLLRLKEAQGTGPYSYRSEAVIIPFKDYSSKRTVSLDRLRL